MRKCFFILQVMMVVCLTSLAGADLLLFDDMEAGTTDNSDASGVLGGFRDSESNGTGNVSLDTGALGNPTVSYRLEGHSSGDERGFTITGVNNPIEEGETGVLFFRFVHRADGRRGYTWFGITTINMTTVADDALNTGNENDADQLISAGFVAARESTTGSDPIHVVRVHDLDNNDPTLDPEEILFDLTPGTWYDCWIEANNATDTFNLYIQETNTEDFGGPPPAQPTSDPVVVDEPFNIPGTDALYGFVCQAPDDPPRPWADRDIRVYADDLWWDGDSGLATSLAKKPDPKNSATLVPIDSDLTWEDPDKDEPNKVVDFTYDVYFGSSVPDANCDGNPQIISDQDVNTAVNGADFGPLAYETTYYWRVDVRDPNGGGNPIIRRGNCWSFTTCPAVPVVLTNPESLTVSSGATAEFTVGTTCGATIFQWKKDGVNLSNGGDIAGADTDTLTISNVEQADEGNYSVVVSNINGSAPETPAAQLLTCRLIAHWPLDGNLTDVVGGFNGTVATSSASSAVYVAGIAGQAYSFIADPNTADPNLNSNYVEITGGADPDTYFNFFTRGYSVSAWVKDATETTWEGLVTKQQTDQATGWLLDISPGGEPQLVIRDSSVSVASSQSVYNSAINAYPIFANPVDPNWHHIVAVFDPSAGEARMYHNGVLAGTDGSVSVPPATLGALVFGAEANDGQDAYDGLLDDVRIYSCPLTAVEIATLYTDVVGGNVCVDPAGLGVFDKNDDCIVDVFDFAIWVEQYLLCKRVPDTECGI